MSSSTELSLTRVLNATPEEVYDAWLDPQAISEWMVPIPGGRTEAQNDPRVGGSYLITLYGNGTRYPTRGEYLRLERPRLLEFSWCPDDRSWESIVTIELKPLGPQRTELSLRHRRLPSPEMVEGHRDGWSSGLDRLVEWAARKHA